MKSRIHIFLTVMVWGSLFATCWALVDSVSTYNYTADSWYFIDIARGLKDNFFQPGDTNGGRNYIYLPGKNSSFPFFWPFLIFLLGLFLPTADTASALIALFAVFLPCCVLLLVWHKHKLVWLYSGLLGLLLMINPILQDDISAGRSHSIAISAYLCAAILLFGFDQDEPINKTRIFCASLFIAISTGSRFDFAPLAFLLILIFQKAFRLEKSKLAILLAGLIVPLMFWSIYSLLNFQTFFASETRQSLFLNKVPLPTDFFVSQNYNEIFLFGGLSRGFNSLFALELWCFLVLVCNAVILMCLLYRRFDKKKFGNIEKNLTGLSILVIGLTCLVFIQISISGYQDSRYWIPVLSTYALLCVFLVKAYIEKSIVLSHPYVQLVAFFLLTTFLTGIPNLISRINNSDFVRIQMQLSEMSDKEIYNCLSKIEGRILFTDSGLSSRIATLGIETMMWPSNAEYLNYKDWNLLIHDFGITGIFSREGPENDVPTNIPDFMGYIHCSA